MNFLLTIDYELPGDGSGDIFELMIEPTKRLLTICNKSDIKITIFFEVVEYWMLKQEWEKKNKMGYQKDPIAAIEKQLQRAAVDGHDIQLHIHPQWVGANYVNNKWELDFANWRLGDFQSKEGYTIESLLLEGKKTIEKIVQPIIPHYECMAIRAGGFNVMPSIDIYAAMKKTGFRIDSSVFPGGYETGTLSNYDYRHVKHTVDFWWVHENNITLHASKQSNVLELPIFALIQPRWRKFASVNRLKLILFRKKSISTLTRSKILKKTWQQKIQFLFEKEAFTWDFFLFNSKLHKRFFNFIDKNLSEQRKYFVLIGHPKSPFNQNAFLDLIKRIKKRKGNFMTITQFKNEVTD